MPLYLVRWPTLVASIVRADDEDHLTDILDEVESPTEAIWTEYDGPLWVDVQLGIEARYEDEKWQLDGVELASGEPWLGARLEPEGADTFREMFEAIFSKAFPRLADVLDKAAAEKDDEAPLDPDTVRGAALMDLWLHRGSGEIPASLRKTFSRFRKGGADDD